MSWIVLIVIVYAAGFGFFHPEVFASTDEALYVEQAAAFAGGTGISNPVSPYPPGTSLLQVPFVLMGGWRAAAWASVMALAATALLLARWLKDAGHPPLTALLFLAYAPALALGRVGTSDMPGAAVVTAGLWLYWTGEGHPSRRFWAGLLAAVSLLFRETNALIFAPFVAAALWRRRDGWKPLAAGLCAGVAVRLAVYEWAFGSVMAIRETTGWAIGAPLHSVPLYVLALFVLVPGGLVAVVLYRGPHAKTLIAAIALYLGVYVFYDYSGQDSAGWARLATGGRYLIPIVPLVTIAWADVAYRRFPGLVGSALPWVAAPVVLAAAAVHPVMTAWSARDARVVRDIQAVTLPGDTLIANPFDRKYVSPLYAGRTRIWMDGAAADPRTLHGGSATYVVVVQRSETPAMAGLSAGSNEYIARARAACQLDLTYERRYPRDRHLQMWNVRACQY